MLGFRMNHHEQKQWWYWPLLPIAAVVGASICSAAVSIFVLLIVKLYGQGEGGGGLTYLLTAGAFGYPYGYIAYSMAPRRKVVASSIMVVILGALVALQAIVTWVAFPSPLPNPILAAVGGIVAVVAAITAIRAAAHS